MCLLQKLSSFSGCLNSVSARLSIGDVLDLKAGCLGCHGCWEPSLRWRIQNLPLHPASRQNIEDGLNDLTFYSICSSLIGSNLIPRPRSVDKLRKSDYLHYHYCTQQREDSSAVINICYCIASIHHSLSESHLHLRKEGDQGVPRWGASIYGFRMARARI